MKRALISLIDDNFIIGMECFFKSLMKHNPWFDLEFVLLDGGLSTDGKKRVKKIYQNTRIVRIKKESYTNINLRKTHERLRKTFWKLDTFIQTDYDRLTFIDMDVLVMGDISELFNSPHGIAGVKAYDRNRDRLVEGINSGVFTINKEYINRHTYTGLLRTARPGYSMPDQKVINRFFAGKIKYFNKSYNVEKRMLHTVEYRHLFDKIKILHFVASKPWEKVKPNELEKRYEKWERLWWEAYDSK